MKTFEANMVPKIIVSASVPKGTAILCDKPRPFETIEEMAKRGGMVVIQGIAGTSAKQANP